MKTRREFLETLAVGGAAVGLAGVASCGEAVRRDASVRRPLIVSTWYHGLPANAEAWRILDEGGSLLDAVEGGVAVVEADPSGESVGLGGRPDREGRVTLDASIMTGDGRAGAVAALEDVVHAAGVARAVMEHTPHVMLVGEGARAFALERGFPARNLLTDETRAAWETWRRESGEYAPTPNVENHDTISLLALGADGRLAGVCTTSGLAYKMSGRVGDSPIIGAALFVDDDVGACCATGLGEAVMTTCGSFLVVELMRQGATPDEACREAVRRIAAQRDDWEDIQVGYVALDNQGRVGSYSLVPGFQYALHDGTSNRIMDVQHRA